MAKLVVPPPSLPWYERPVLLAIVCYLCFPLFLYGLWKTSIFPWESKVGIAVGLAFLLLVIGFITRELVFW